MMANSENNAGADFDWLKNNPHKASIGIAAVGHRVLAAVFKKETGTRFGAVPCRGAAPAVQDLVAGQIGLSMAIAKVDGGFWPGGDIYTQWARYD
jgi:tripartite-type tricarboxylate transporter receptor subunit TctC